LLYLFPERVETNAAGAPVLHWAAGAQAFAPRETLEANGSLTDVLVLPSALSSSECRDIVALGERHRLSRATVERGHTVDYRASVIAWLEPEPQAHWLYHRLATLFLEANRSYRFALTGFVDALQYTVYGPEDRFDWHMDLGATTTSARKLSLSVLLNTEADYTGGRLEFLAAPRSAEPLPAGSAVFFPSYMVHRVSRIAAGTRRSLVAWAAGAPFR
jgi:PKHD-type hydroxylase